MMKVCRYKLPSERKTFCYQHCIRISGFLHPSGGTKAPGITAPFRVELLEPFPANATVAGDDLPVEQNELVTR